MIRVGAIESSIHRNAFPPSRCDSNRVFSRPFARRFPTSRRPFREPRAAPSIQHIQSLWWLKSIRLLSNLPPIFPSYKMDSQPTPAFHRENFLQNLKTCLVQPYTVDSCE